MYLKNVDERCAARPSKTRTPSSKLKCNTCSSPRQYRRRRRRRAKLAKPEKRHEPAPRRCEGAAAAAERPRPRREPRGAAARRAPRAPAADDDGGLDRPARSPAPGRPAPPSTVPRSVKLLGWPARPPALLPAIDDEEEAGWSAGRGRSAVMFARAAAAVDQQKPRVNTRRSPGSMKKRPHTCPA